MRVLLLATLDTKGTEADFIRRQLDGQGIQSLLADVGCLGAPTVPADIAREAIFKAAGEDLRERQASADRGAAIAAAARGAARIARERYVAGEIQGVLAMGGSAGTTIGTSAMRALPLGVPKLMVSTLASGQVRPYVAEKDILMLNSVVDIAGINRVSRLVLGNAAAAMAGMIRRPPIPTPAVEQPLIAATMFGVTTPCVERAREVLERAGYEVLVFHATGNGGQAMESLIREGLIAGVLDMTTTEMADELVGGVLSAGPTRLTAAGEMGIPQVVSVGALDMVNFGPPDTVPEQFQERKFYRHNPNVTLMRTTVEENVSLGREIGRKLSQATRDVAVLLPTEGVSAIDRQGQPFDDPVARRALYRAITETAPNLAVEELPCHINDPAFAEAAAAKLLEMLARRAPASSS